MGELADRGGHHSGKRRHQADALGIEQHGGVIGREAEAPSVIDLEDGADGLLLEPFARVARIGPGAAGELFGRGRPIVGQDRYQPRRSPR